MTDFSGPRFLSHIPNMCPGPSDAALPVPACGWVGIRCVHRIRTRAHVTTCSPLVSPPLGRLPEEPRPVWMVVWGGRGHGGGGGKAALTQIPAPSACLQFPLGSIWHAVDGGAYPNCECLLEGEMTNCNGLLPGKRGPVSAGCQTRG